MGVWMLKGNFSIPNILSVFRILLIPVFVILYLDEGVLTEKSGYLPGAVLALSAATDYFDGLIARKFNMITEFGKILDPIADKLTQVVVGVCVVIKHHENTALIILMSIVMLKETLMAIFSLRLLKIGKRPSQAKWYGKLGTFAFYLVMMLIILFNLEQWIITTMVAVVAVIMIFAFVNYGKFYLKTLNNEKNEKLNIQ